MMNVEFKKALVSMVVCFVVFCCSIVVYSVVDLMDRKTDQEIHDRNCRSCALITKEMRARNIKPLALR